MASPSNEDRQKYALAVYVEGKSKSAAYSEFIDPDALAPAQQAQQFEKSQIMTDMIETVQTDQTAFGALMQAKMNRNLSKALDRNNDLLDSDDEKTIAKGVKLAYDMTGKAIEASKGRPPLNRKAHIIK